MSSEPGRPDLLKAARTFASGSHERIGAARYAGQQTAESHLKAVVQMVGSVTQDQHVLAAAWLHDIVEDTAFTVDEIDRRFGRRVARLVAEVTLPARRGGRAGAAPPPAAEARRVAGISADAKTIKIADLADTLHDLRKASPPSAGALAAESRGLLAALEGGHPALVARLEREMARCAGAPATAPVSPRTLRLTALPPSALRAFERAFTVNDIAEPLRCFDGARDGLEVLQAMQRAGVEVAGIREAGLVSGYVTTSDLRAGPAHSIQREIAPEQLVAADASLGDVIEILTVHDWCFVTAFGSVAGTVSRLDVQKPAVRMWLFGIITVVEIEATERVARMWPAEAWVSQVSPARLDKASQLLQERQRRNEPCRLLDCLQLGDKLQLLVSDPSELDALGLPTASAARRLSAQIERLRNSLAHAQPFVEQDWPQVVRLARRIASFRAGMD